MSLEDDFIPETIVITNFNNIANMTLPVGALNIITGKNGSGKTSIAEAIDFCLTGQVMRNVPISDVVMRGKKTAEVTIRGTHNGDPIEITRRRTGRNQKVRVVVGSGDGKAEVSNPKDFLETIVTHLEFEKIYYLNGHDLSKFVSGSPSETSEMLDKLFSIDILDDIVKESGRQSNALRKRIGVLEASIETLNRKRELAEKVAKWGDEKAVLEATVADLNAKIPPLKAELEPLLPKVTDLKDKIKQKNILINFKENQSRKRAEIAARKDGLLSKIKLIDDASVDGLDDAIGASEKELESLRNELAEKRAKITMFKDLPATIERVIDASGDAQNDACPVCLAPGRREDASKNLEAMKVNQRSTVIAMLRETKKIQDEIAGKEDAARELETQKRSIERKRIERNLLEKQLEEVRKEEGELQDVKDGEIDDLKGNRDAIEGELSSVQRAVVEIETRIGDAERDLKDAKHRLETASNDTGISWGEDDERDLSEKEGQMRSAAGKRDVLEEVKRGFKEILSGIREIFMNAINPKIMTEINRFGADKTPINGFRIVPSRRQRGSDVYYHYDFTVEVNGEELSFNALSTGQKALSLVAVILKLINHSERSLSLLVFDEIDNCGLDKENLEVILRSIIGLSRQIKIIFINRDKDVINYILEEGRKKGVDIPVHEMPDPTAGRDRNGR